LVDGKVDLAVERALVGIFPGALGIAQFTLFGIRDSASSIQRNSGAVSASAGEISKRTEAQAANLEETAAAVEEIT
ncbi:methyl-accepting chemotaxis protein, partial [Rhizobium ruizarguesonis]